MKIKNIFKGFAGVVLAASMMGCSSDYLDLKPITNESASTVSTTAEGIKLGVYGMCRAMYMQYGALDGYMFFNGEPWVSTFYGDIFGQDYYSYFWANQMGNINMNWGQMHLTNGWQPMIGWMYSYTLINMANNIFAYIDEATGSKKEIDFRRAQALTIRAHAYYRLLQIYGPRWQDSNNGNTNVCVIRNYGDGQDVPLSTMNDVLDQIYSDLNTALDLYKSSEQKRNYNWEPDASVAMGVYARTALLQQDYKTAQKMAHDARQGYEIMTMEQYKGGFAEANQEWMWNNAADIEGIYYWAFGSIYACNGPYPILWGLGAGSINIDLYRQMDANDGRRAMFLMPDNLLQYKGIDEASFWNSSVISPTSMNMIANSNSHRRAATAYSLVMNPDRSKFPLAYKVPEGEKEPTAGLIVPFGAQYKFWGLDDCGTGSYPFMRGAEMLLIEAESAYELNDETTAKACLNELNSKRIPGYTCSTSGTALRDEIRLSRRIELWGEGHNWFDFKRWNLPIERRAWVEGDVTSGNIPAVNAGKYEPDWSNGWRFALPRRESDYNYAIDQTKVVTTPAAPRKLK